MVENRNIDTDTFSQSMAIPFHEISTLWYSTRHMIKAWVFPCKSGYGKNLGYRYPYFQVIRPPVPSNFHPMVYYVPWMVHAFSYEFSLACLNSVKHSYQIENYQIGRTWYRYSYFSQDMGLFASVELPSHEILKRDTCPLSSGCVSFHI